ncbi:MAG TPA: bifunctional 5,10-methylenetetrahydrofolate dehydrogenase/5,10-methenyltetrahydrofolate cyclohydrolase [Candidatus Eisenbacteria bacterium]|nr:bifunctional 5,10-methylenetetrahydrofolate dehydrogenase/5,10-methenyltetrahydrofolate cyclohydrolase [Candidatus Eisenbacteria bacterium]
MTTAPAAALLLGGPLAMEIRADVKRRFASLRERGITPGLAIVTVGEPPAGNPYVRAKVKAAEEAGAAATVTRLPADIGAGGLRDALKRIGDDPAVHGLILQLPLPHPLKEERHLEDVPPQKDVDGIHPANVGRWVNGLSAPRPATPLGVQELLRRHAGDLTGKRVCVLGRSRIVGRPLSVLLSSKEKGMNATVTLCHSETRDLASLTREAEILVVAIGRPRAIGAAHVRPGAVVIDVGIHPIQNPAPGAPKYEGDVDMESVRSIVSAITPVPGGVGPLTVAMLLRNLADAAEGIAAS